MPKLFLFLSKDLGINFESFPFLSLKWEIKREEKSQIDENTKMTIKKQSYLTNHEKCIFGIKYWFIFAKMMHLTCNQLLFYILTFKIFQTFLRQHGSYIKSLILIEINTIILALLSENGTMITKPRQNFPSVSPISLETPRLSAFSLSFW